MNEYVVTRVATTDVDELVPLMRAYCHFYAVSVADDEMRALAMALIADPDNEGVQLLARDSDGHGAGFATVFWSWSTVNACRIGVMNDLFVAEDARGRGVAEQLVAACRAECARRGAKRLVWQTAPENRRARAVYDRIGAGAATWVEYVLEVRPGDTG